ncbi:unnamed protein product [Acanthosepion pharaonis]|uniref:Uncharacterized protein n=1 Tax=Acanthosepion pharaonis TaxID=158019 RepID=A0A812E843_ACAPH|nr:unnamed protein product [Sepia pharaonis]
MALCCFLFSLILLFINTSFLHTFSFYTIIYLSLSLCFSTLSHFPQASCYLKSIPPSIYIHTFPLFLSFLSFSSFSYLSLNQYTCTLSLSFYHFLSFSSFSYLSLSQYTCTLSFSFHHFPSFSSFSYLSLSQYTYTLSLSLIYTPLYIHTLFLFTTIFPLSPFLPYTHFYYSSLICS